MAVLIRTEQFYIVDAVCIGSNNGVTGFQRWLDFGPSFLSYVTYGLLILVQFITISTEIRSSKYDFVCLVIEANFLLTKF